MTKYPVTKYQKGSIVLIALAIVALIGAGAIILLKNPNLIKIQPRACTQEAKVCPDGSSVSRSSPACDFAPCLSAQPTTFPNETSGWKTYRNNNLLFSIEMPEDMKLTREEPNSITWQGNYKEINIIFEDNPKAQKPYGKAEPLSENNIYILCGTGDQAPKKITLLGRVAVKCADSRFLNGDNYPEDGATSIDYYILDVRNSTPRSIRLWGTTLKDSAVDPKIIDQILSTFRFLDK